MALWRGLLRTDWRRLIAECTRSSEYATCDHRLSPTAACLRRGVSIATVFCGTIPLLTYWFAGGRLKAALTGAVACSKLVRIISVPSASAPGVPSRSIPGASPSAAVASPSRSDGVWASGAHACGAAPASLLSVHIYCIRPLLLRLPPLLLAQASHARDASRCAAPRHRSSTRPRHHGTVSPSRHTAAASSVPIRRFAPLCAGAGTIGGQFLSDVGLSSLANVGLLATLVSGPLAFHWRRDVPFGHSASVCFSAPCRGLSGAWRRWEERNHPSLSGVAKTHRAFSLAPPRPSARSPVHHRRGYGRLLRREEHGQDAADRHQSEEDCGGRHGGLALLLPDSDRRKLLLRVSGILPLRSGVLSARFPRARAAFSLPAAPPLFNASCLQPPVA